MIILDASVVGPITLPDEPDLPEWFTLRLIDETVMAPAHWRLEVANLLQVALRRGRISSGVRSNALRQMDAMGVSLDTETSAMAWRESLALSDLHGLTMYDAAYLELAIRKQASLATLDRELIAAAPLVGVPILTF